MFRERENVGTCGVFLCELDHGRSLLAVIVGMPFPAEFLVDDAFAILAVRHVLFFDGGDESEAVCLFPFPTRGFAECPDDAVAINVSVRLKVLELVVYVNLFAVDIYFFHAPIRR